jgi:hypothetical protein
MLVIKIEAVKKFKQRKDKINFLWDEKQQQYHMMHRV